MRKPGESIGYVARSLDTRDFRKTNSGSFRHWNFPFDISGTLGYTQLFVDNLWNVEPRRKSFYAKMSIEACLSSYERLWIGNSHRVTSTVLCSVGNCELIKILKTVY